MDIPTQSVSLGSLCDLWQADSRMYAGIRSLDKRHVDVILARDLGAEGLGLACAIVFGGQPGELSNDFR